ncbi:MFS transporter [Streptomyces sp. NPDC005438]|uniref:CynX/NimT family MFS transporter n=1 Tax=Streptomyces sp. NPDC005438 TaxID=3156880 RepID=UPI00339DE856
MVAKEAQAPHGGGEVSSPPRRTSGADSTSNPPFLRSRWFPWWAALGLLLAGLNLRPAISGLGPILAEVRQGLGMSGAVAGLLTSVPPLSFAVFGGLAPRLARRWGAATVIGGGMGVLTLGLALRSLAPGTVVFLVASVLALAGIAVSNVLMPVAVKQWFPHRVGTMTGLYSMALSLGTAGAAAVTVPMTQALGGSWRLGLGMWLVLSVSALLPWVTLARTGRRAAPTSAVTPAERPGSVATDPATDPAADPARASAAASTTDTGHQGPPGSLLRSPTAWALCVFFGLQATGAYVIMGWLPQIFRDAGVSASTAGLLLALTMGLGVPLSFVLPRLASTVSRQGPLVLALGACGLAGYTGLWWAPAGGAWVWALLLGVSNCAFPLALTMIGMRARTSAGVVRLSAFAQSGGYLLSMPGPLLVGVLRESSGGWHLPLGFLVVLLCAQMLAGLVAGRDRCVEDGD